MGRKCRCDLLFNRRGRRLGPRTYHLDPWAYWNHLELDFSRPGKLGDNAHIEAFNSIVRRECLSQHWFSSIEDARRILDEWRKEYNKVRPHGIWAAKFQPDIGLKLRRTQAESKLEGRRPSGSGTGGRASVKYCTATARCGLLHPAAALPAWPRRRSPSSQSPAASAQQPAKLLGTPRRPARRPTSGRSTSGQGNPTRPWGNRPKEGNDAQVDTYAHARPVIRRSTSQRIPAYFTSSRRPQLRSKRRRRRARSRRRSRHATAR